MNYLLEGLNMFGPFLVIKCLVNNYVQSMFIITRLEPH